MSLLNQDLGLTDISAEGGCCSGDACACGGHDAAQTSAHQTAAVHGHEEPTITYSVSGMTCEHCVRAVTKEVSAIPGVAGLTIDLQPEGLSTLNVTGASVTPAAVRAAVEEAGYELAFPARG